MLNDGAPPAAAPQPRWRRLLSWELLAFLAVFVGLQFWQSREMASGDMSPLAGRTAAGREASLAALLQGAGGGPALVYVWATWCPVCRIEEGAVKSLAADWPVLTVAMQSGEADEVAKFMARRGTTYPALVDPRGETAGQLGVRGVPAYFVVDGRGRIRFTGAGYTPGWSLRLRLWWAKMTSA